MKLPDHLRANGTGFAVQGAAVSFAALPDLHIILRDHQGRHQEPLTNPETAHWIAKVLTAAIQWGHTRTSTHAVKVKATHELLEALAGGAGYPGLLAVMGEDLVSGDLA